MKPEPAPVCDSKPPTMLEGYANCAQCGAVFNNDPRDLDRITCCSVRCTVLNGRQVEGTDDAEVFVSFAEEVAQIDGDCDEGRPVQVACAQLLVWYLNGSDDLTDRFLRIALQEWIAMEGAA